VTGIQVVHAIEAGGGILALNGDRIRCKLPEDADPLLELLRAHRDEVFHALRERGPDDLPAPVIPKGMRLIEWRPKKPPIAVSDCSVVIDVRLYVARTLAQLAAALEGDNWRAGNWSPQVLQERLERCGCRVEVC